MERDPFRLLDLSSPIDEWNNTFLHLAVAQNDELLVKLLLLKGAPVNTFNQAGVSPLRLAQLLDLKSDIIQLLQRHGAKRDALVNQEIKDVLVNEADAKESAQRSKTRPVGTPIAGVRYAAPSYLGPNLHNAAGIFGRSLFAATCSRATLEELNEHDLRRVTPLMKAAYRGRTENLKTLLEIDPTGIQKIDVCGRDAFWYACYSGKRDCVKLIWQEMRGQKLKPIHPEYLLAAVYSGNDDLVRLLLDAKVAKSMRLDDEMKHQAIRLAVLLGRLEMVATLKASGSILFYDEVTMMLWKSLATMEGLDENIVEDEQRLKEARLPVNNMLVILANDYLGKLKQILNESAPGTTTFTGTSEEKQTLKLVLRSQQEHQLEGLKTCWAARIIALREATMESRLDELETFTGEVKQQLGEDTIKSYEPEILQLLDFFQQKGTALDCMHMTMVRQILSLMQATAEGKKVTYIALAGKAIQTATDILQTVESIVGPCGSSERATPQIRTIFNGSFLYQKAREIGRHVRKTPLDEMLRATRLAVGAWPPPDAVAKMISSARTLAFGIKQVVNIANGCGAWPITPVTLANYVNSIDTTPISPWSASPSSSSISYKQYQKLNEQRLLEKLAEENSDAFTNAVKVEAPPSTVSSTKDDVPAQEQPFFDHLEHLIRQFVGDVQRLKAARMDDNKGEYVTIASIIYSRLDGMIEEIQEYYLFKNVADDYCVAPKQVPVKRALITFKTTCLQLANELVLKSKLASGVWPPPSAADDMIAALIPCVATIKKSVLYAKEVAVIMRRTEDVQRSKMEQWMQVWNQNARVRELFNQWDSLQVSTAKSKSDEHELISIYGSLPMITQDIKEMLADSTDGLIFEEKDGRQIIKAGRLVRLVERLVDHTAVDIEYRDAFMLTYHSFTTSLDLLDHLVKRYELIPPYGLDQQKFDIFVSRKLVPIRARVLAVLKHWTSKYPEDFTRNRELTKASLDIIQRKMSTDFSAISQQLVKALRSYLEGEKVINVVLDPNKPIPKPILPRGMTLQKLEIHLNSSDRAYIDIDAVELARQNTLIDASTMRDIRPKEFLDQGWEKPDKQKRSPNITRIIQQTNNISNWVANQVITCPDLKQRAVLIKYFVTMAQVCICTKNMIYNCLGMPRFK
jgi:ankyrin repeat protein